MKYIYKLYFLLARLISSKMGWGLFSYQHHRIRSESDDGRYTSSVKKAVYSERAFSKFKRDYNYSVILEHVSVKHAERYVEILKERNDGFLERALDTLMVDDNLGSPRKVPVSGLKGNFSTTSIRYLKVASDINLLFGPDFLSTAEIGCGYGGQCIFNDSLLNVESAYLFDLPIVNKLISRYINYFLLRGSFHVAHINNTLPRPYDLVISNYAFSELPRDLQLSYMSKILAHSKKGYLTMNSGIGGVRDEGKLSLDEILSFLPDDAAVLEEDPNTYNFNYLLVWGYDSDTLNKNFTVKTV